MRDEGGDLGTGDLLAPLLVRAAACLAILLSVFQLWTAGFGVLTALVQRSVHLALILALAFLLRPPFKGARRDRLTPWLVLDVVLVLASFGCCAYVVVFLDEIYERQGEWLARDVLAAALGVLLVLEACRRVIGWFMASCVALFLAYAFLGAWMPDLFAHKGYGLTRIATTLFLTTEGVFGVPLGVAATFVFIFVLFGAFLEASGGGSFFIDLAQALTGRFSGGPAKTAVIASGLMGSVSGSAVANVVTTGAFTIPMMKKVGYRPHVAGAIEAAASTGGQIMPPVMGAGAFLMAEFTNTSYLTIVKISIVPALLYYMTVLLFVHFEAKKQGLAGQPRESLPKALRVLSGGLHFIIPLVALVVALVMNVSPTMAGFVAVASTFLASALRKASRMGPRLLLQALEKGAKNAVTVSVACAAAGIIVGVIGLTGQGLNLSSLVLALSLDIKLLAILLIGTASLVLGMGLPVTASYIVLVTLAGPALLDLGVPLLVGHMVVFWYSQLSNVTPPVSLAAFAGAGLAGAHPMRTALVACNLAKGLFIIPLVMAYRPLLGNGPAGEVAVTMIASAAGLLAVAAGMERFLVRRATALETALFLLAGLCLLWPDVLVAGLHIPARASDAAGLALLVGAGLLQLLHRPDVT
ncbi:MAG: TRAP transporter permease [Planctomycetes bacterium]|nr:TRAP transporter permease [Planctomycetota bacterium]